MRKGLLFFAALLIVNFLFAQEAENLPTDYLSAFFHKGRREALRALMPANSVVVIFANPFMYFQKMLIFHIIKMQTCIISPAIKNPMLYC